MRNEMSEVGMAEDMIRSYVQFGCAEIHAKGLYEKASAELENGLIDVTDSEVLQHQLEKCEQYKEDINTYAELRRSVMRKLFSLFEHGNRDLWCMAKHLGIGAMCLFEAYEASDDDGEMLMLCLEANKAFVSAMSRFLGVEITDCAACLADALKGENEDGNRL